ncbi:MAG: glycosyltransferase, partial [Bacteroidota bacterium]
MPDVMRACDTVVLPFLDSFGPSDYFLAGLEAMASGKPVIVSRVGGMPEVVDPSVGFLVDPMDVSEITAAMLSLAADSGLRAQLGRNARARVVEHFSVSNIAARFDDLYKRVAATA